MLGCYFYICSPIAVPNVLIFIRHRLLTYQKVNNLSVLILGMFCFLVFTFCFFLLLHSYFKSLM